MNEQSRAHRRTYGSWARTVGKPHSLSRTSSTRSCAQFCKGESVTITGFGVSSSAAVRPALPQPRTSETVKVKPTSVPCISPRRSVQGGCLWHSKLSSDGPAVKRGAVNAAVMKAARRLWRKGRPGRRPLPRRGCGEEAAPAKKAARSEGRRQRRPLRSEGRRQRGRADQKVVAKRLRPKAAPARRLWRRLRPEGAVAKYRGDTPRFPKSSGPRRMSPTGAAQAVIDGGALEMGRWQPGDLATATGSTMLPLRFPIRLKQTITGAPPLA